MKKLNVFYIKDLTGQVVYTNTNEFEFTSYVNDYLELGIKSRYINLEDIQKELQNLEIGKKEIEINL